jgi:MraZ protein
MDEFFGTHRNRIDAKGRVSIPATFRAALRTDSGTALVLRRSHRHRCIEGWSPAAFRAQVVQANAIRPLDPDQEDDALTLFGNADMPTVDKEGRMTLPPEMAAHAGITDVMAFVGLGHCFQIWEPEALERRRAAARASAEARWAQPAGAA